MTFYKKTFLTIMLGLSLSACLEPQIAPDIESISSDMFSIDPLSGPLSSPWSVIPLPSQMGYLVTERTGALKHIMADGQSVDISGLPNDIYVEQQAGLFDVRLAANFAKSNRIYLSYARGTAKANATVIISAKLNKQSLTEIEDVFQAKPLKDTASHFGGRLEQLEDESLILTLGDGFTYREAAQDKSSHLGKIVRIMPDGSTPADNPLSGDTSAKPEIYSYGHRNVQGLFYDSQNGKLWSHEHGPRGGDELNLIHAGKNYGWPLATSGTDYNGAKISPHKTVLGTEAFVRDWVPSIAPSGLLIYDGELFPEWQGDIFIGGLASKDLRRLDMDGNAVKSETRLLSDLNGRVRDIKQDYDGGLLVLIEDEIAGELLKLTPRGLN